MATTIDWKLPPGISAGQPEWPIPEKLFDKDLTTYIYQDEMVVLIPLKLDPKASPGTVTLKAALSWLECDIQCVPGQATVTADLKIGSESKLSTDATLIAAWEKKLPKPGDSVGGRTWWEKPATGDLRSVVIEWRSSNEPREADFYPDGSDTFEVQPQVETVAAEKGVIRIRKEIKKMSGDWPGRISGLLVEGTGNGKQAWKATLELAPPSLRASARQGSNESGAALTAPGGTPQEASPTPVLWKALLYAFVGGLILNVMPCVLPVIALKILGFVGQAKDAPARVRFLGLVYAAGVLVSFLALAGLVLGVKAVGKEAGWGIQFGNPYFLIAMTILVTLIALNLFGVFEVHLGSRTMDAAAGLSSKHGVAGAFFNGLLATVLATSCTAPFLGTAIGFAFAPSQTAGSTVSVFLCIGIGLSLPYVLLSWQPRWLKILPKPGAWMERFKIIMGFPMLAVAVWLFSLVTIYYGDRSYWLAGFLVILALAAWVYGEFVQRHPARPILAMIIVALLLVAGYVLPLEKYFQWRSPLTQAQEERAKSVVEGSGELAGWEPWSVGAVAHGRAEGRPVLVDFTAKWCLTCNTIVKPALESASVQEKIQQLNVVPLLGDYTRISPEISAELKRHGRAGVPLVLVYPADSGKPPIVLPEALTAGMVVNALDLAAKGDDSVAQKRAEKTEGRK
jgi:thiol:disulfide interchange protein DsbD